ncbi:rho-related GTP-binding protein RhoV-like [Mercenaria mercenaria]|uniref:rho-related GTP-binding protein RhoV-like n=1 Tax=Mercenaria mercenaria TaxID=6596 RepID=UPI00234F9517|nr:rho-related GTP-binding protein RhoV-like [Mercenaria mercenaria]
MNKTGSECAYRNTHCTRGVGKTCLMKTYVDNSFPSEYVPTVFDNYTAVLSVEGQRINLGLWDTSGQSNYDRLRPLAYPQTDVFLLCFAVDSRDSYDNLKQRWVPEVRHHCPSTPIIVVGTKLDKRDSSVDHDKNFVSNSRGVHLMKEIGARRYLECSALTQKGVTTVFEEAVKIALEPPPKKKNEICSLFYQSVLSSVSQMAAEANIKCVVIGDGNVGKTCLAKTYVNNSFPPEYTNPTVYDNYTAVLTIEGRRFNLALTDTAGKEDYDRLRPLSYPQTDVFLLCFAVDSRDSYDNVWEKWAPEVLHYCPSTPIILVGTKLDERESHVDRDKKFVSNYEQGVYLMKKIGARRYLECSALAQQGVTTVFEEAVKIALEPPPKKKKNKCSLF